MAKYGYMVIVIGYLVFGMNVWVDVVGVDECSRTTWVPLSPEAKSKLLLP